MRKYLSLCPAILSLTLTVSAQPQQSSLKDAYQGCFLVGAALNSAEFTGKDQAADAIIKAQFNTISPENVLKWEVVHPKPGAYEFGLADQYVEFGQQNHMFIIGHNLVWHSQVPKWVFEDDKGNPISRDALLERLHDHIRTVVGRYKGRINGWDVVNEVVADDGTLRQSPWLKILGEDYIAQAFRFAHEADPQAELYYNDYSLQNEAKRKGALALVKKLKAEGVPITGVGLQDHVSMDWPSTEQIDKTISDFGKLHVKVMITELDVDVLPSATKNQTADVAMHAAADPKLNPYPNGLPESVQEALAKRYADLFGAYAKHCGLVTRVTFWGVTDKDSWKNNWPIRGRTNYPLLFDRNDQPKPAFDAVIHAAPKKSS
ncbi:MAG TPA: endo-1,4-beta-xylanase [Candidatus Acidoferrales bacterium]|nr:endo-1,4-beta-xylanase [Candidatus Acidoferrales bacterium]